VRAVILEATMRLRITLFRQLTLALLTATLVISLNSSAQTPENGKSALVPADRLAQAKSLLNAGQFGEAESDVRRFLQAHPGSADAHFLLGYILFREIQATAVQQGHEDSKYAEQNAKASLAEYTQGAKYRDPGAFDLKIVGLDYVLLRDYADADKWLTKSVVIDPRDSEAWYYLGRAKYNEERFAEAIRPFQQCLSLNPKYIKAGDNLGLSYAALGRNEEAIVAYQKAISWQSDSLIKDSGPYIDLGILLLDQNKPEGAVGYFKQGVEIAPNESRGHAGLGKAYLKLEQLENAQSELEKAVQLAPENASLHYVLGQIYRKRGLVEKAQAEFDRTAKLNGSHSSPVNDRPEPHQ
jgi:Flp pilus assembly protein TadD